VLTILKSAARPILTVAFGLLVRVIKDDRVSSADLDAVNALLRRVLEAEGLISRGP
jgi:hypothetical protein